MARSQSSRKATLKQAGAIPFRHENGEVKVCLVTSSGSGKWGIPKGIIDPGETPKETALKEAEEEAGITGDVIEGRIGEYTYRKWGMILEVRVFLLRVTREFDKWHERHARRRRWVSLKKAARLLSEHPVLDLWETAEQRMREFQTTD